MHRIGYHLDPLWLNRSERSRGTWKGKQRAVPRSLACAIASPCLGRLLRLGDEAYAKDEEAVGSVGREGETQDGLPASADKLWQAVLGELQLQMTRATFDTWLRGSQAIAMEDNVLTVHVRHTYAVDWLDNRLMPVVQRALWRHANPEMKIVFTARAPEPHTQFTFKPETVEQPEPSALDTGSVRVNGRPSSALNPRYTFTTFVVGGSNRLAHAASLAVAENPAHAYNPLFIYGGVGLGKTHLLHALGHAIQQRGGSILYVSAEWFTNDLINAIRKHQTEAFRAKYRSADALLVDDVQFIVGKESTQEEFFHTFDTLHGAGKQLVLSCDRPPKALVALEDRLSSRFGWGLIADVQAPDYETRLAILRAKAESFSVFVPDEVLAHIARKIASNIRDLEGALTRVVAHSQLMHLPQTLETAKDVLDSILAETPDLSPQQIVAAVARHYGLSEGQLAGRSRRREVSLPRQLCMYLIRQETRSSLPQIGELLGGRDHSTILHGCEKIGAQIDTDEKLRRDWLAIKEVLSQNGRGG
jgi:chromosomal replication initiator protein